MNLGKCDFCGKEVEIPFTCSYCGQQFCSEHRLPENHMCPSIPERSWDEYQKMHPIRIDSPSTLKHTQHELDERRSRHKSKKKGKVALVIIFLVIGTMGFFYIQSPQNFTSEILSIPERLIELTETITTQIGTTVEETIGRIPETTEQPSTLEIERYIFNYTNNERNERGIDPLEWDDELAEIAREHSRDMIENDFFDHTNLAGETPTDRAKRHGYSLHKDLGGGWYSEGIGENIATMATGYVQGHGYVNNDSESIARALVDSWMNSTGHRENILNQDYDKIGVGVAYDGSTHYYATQDFW